MIRSPGFAALIAAWTDCPAVSRVGDFPPTVTVTVSMDSSPLADLTTSCPQRAGCPGAGPPYCCCCCTRQAGMPAGTVTTIWESLQLVTAAVTPPICTDPVPCTEPKP